MHIDVTQIIIYLLGIAVPFLIGLLLHSPLGSKLPKNVVNFLTSVDTATIQLVAEKALDCYKDRNEAYKLAAYYIQDTARKHEIDLTDNEAMSAVHWIVDGLKAGRILIKA